MNIKFPHARVLRAWLMALLTGAMLAACSDNNDGPADGDDDVNPAAYGLLGGSRVVIWKVSDGSLEVPLYGNAGVKVTDLVHHWQEHPEGISALIDERPDGSRTLKVTLPELSQMPPVLSFDVKLTEEAGARGGEATTHTLTVVTRNTSTPDPDMKAKVDQYDCLFTTMGRGMNMGGELGGENINNPVLDFNAILPLVYKGMQPNETFSWSFEYSNSTYSETSRNYGFQLGVSGSKGINTEDKKPFFKKMEHLCFSGSFDFALDINSNVKEYYEYDVFCYINRLLIDKLEDLWSAKPEQLVGYIDSVANDALNNPASQTYLNYPNTRDGIFSLLDAFGTHVITKGHFGGRWTYLYGRKQNAYQYSTATGSHGSLGLHNSSGTTNPDHPFAQWYVNKMTAAGIDVNVGLDTYSEDIEETAACIAVETSRGGVHNSDPEVWEQSFDRDNPKLALIAFGDPVTENDEDFGGLLEITMFCLEPERLEAILTYIDEYIDSQIHGTTGAKLVLADVFMLKDDDNAGGGVDPTKQRVMTDAFGVKRLYTPMYVNQYGRNEDRREKALDTSGDDFISVADACDQYWYATLDWSTECNGIIDICFSDNDDNDLFYDGYTRRGARADSGMNWDAIDNNYLCVKYKTEHNVGNLITGFGLCYGDESNKATNLKTNDIFSTSIGTEMTFPFAVGRDNFEKYWKQFSYSVYSTHSWWGDNAAIRKHFYPVFTTQELPSRYNSGNVCLPKGS